MAYVLSWFLVSLAFKCVLSAPMGPQNYIVESAHIVAYESDCTPSMFRSRGTCTNVHHHCTSILTTRVLLEFSCHEDCCFDAEIVSCVCDHGSRGSSNKGKDPFGRGGSSIDDQDPIMFSEIIHSYPRKTGEPSTDRPFIKNPRMGDLKPTDGITGNNGMGRFNGNPISFIDIIDKYPRKMGEPSTDRPYFKQQSMNDLRVSPSSRSNSQNVYRDTRSKMSSDSTIMFPEIMDSYPRKTAEPSTDRPIVKESMAARFRQNEEELGTGRNRRFFVDEESKIFDDDIATEDNTGFEIFKIYKNADMLSNSVGSSSKGVGVTDKPWWVETSQNTGTVIEQDIIPIDSFSEESEDNIREKRRGFPSPDTDEDEKLEVMIVEDNTETSSDVSDEGPTEGAQSDEETTTPSTTTKKPKDKKHKKDKSVVKARKSKSGKNQEEQLSVTLG